MAKNIDIYVEGTEGIGVANKPYCYSDEVEDPATDIKVSVDIANLKRRSGSVFFATAGQTDFTLSSGTLGDVILIFRNGIFEGENAVRVSDTVFRISPAAEAGDSISYISF